MFNRRYAVGGGSRADRPLLGRAPAAEPDTTLKAILEKLGEIAALARRLPDEHAQFRDRILAECEGQEGGGWYSARGLLVDEVRRALPQPDTSRDNQRSTELGAPSATPDGEEVKL